MLLNLQRITQAHNPLLKERLLKLTLNLLPQQISRLFDLPYQRLDRRKRKARSGLPPPLNQFLKIAARLLHQESGKFAPHHHAMLELEGEAWRLAHDPTAAIQTWQTLLQQTPDKLVIGLRLAHLYLKQERWEKALALLGELPGEGSPTQEAEHRLLLGISATRAGHPEQARTAAPRTQRAQKAQRIKGIKRIKA